MDGNLVKYALSASLALLFGNATLSRAQTVAVRDRDASAKLATVTLDIVDVPRSEALKSIARQAKLRLTWNSGMVDLSGRISLHVHDIAADQAIAQVIAGTGAHAEIAMGRLLLVQDNALTQRQQGEIHGKVLDAKTQRPIQGASISLGEASPETRSGDDGTFRIANLPRGKYTVHVRKLGYASAAKVVMLADEQTAQIDITLEPSTNTLDQVVVTGTIIPTELKAVPNAITVITAKDIEQRGITHVDQLFRGDVPGLFAQNQGSVSPLDQVAMFSRGATKFSRNTTVAATNPIKTYVDGVELADPSYLSQIDPASIERIEILTGPQASTIYGSNAINGVMQIFTKRGNTSKPQMTVAVQHGLIQNNFSSALVPEGDYTARLAGTEGHISYEGGGSLHYVGRWTPSKRTIRSGGDGGARMQLGPVTADVSFRRENTDNHGNGSTSQGQTALRESGFWIPVRFTGLAVPTTAALHGQTLGLTIDYAPVSWWSQEVGLGTDASNTETISTGRGYTSSSDTLLTLSQTQSVRTSLRTVSTVRASLTPSAHLMMTVGVDGWKSLTSSTDLFGVPMVSGTLTSLSNSLVRQPSHDVGGFFQGQLGLWDAWFLTYGLRAEWNPYYGDNVNPNVAPRYGMAYTWSLASLTVKMRASYGRATRPPLPDQKQGYLLTEYGAMILSSYYANVLAPIYGNYQYYRPANDLAPEFQQGGEGGLELYLGNRGSLVVTRYNQTVAGLIATTRVDSVAPLDPANLATSGYSSVFQNLNIGNVRNQGWELQGSANAGPFTTKGTYSWTKSRIIGITPAYRDRFAGSTIYRPGAPFDFLPEHTWAVTIGYGSSKTTVAFTLNGIGKLYRAADKLTLVTGSSFVRLPQNSQRIVLPDNYHPIGTGYVMADVNVARRISSQVEGMVQIRNLSNYYRQDIQSYTAVIGRQSLIGIRVR